MNLNIQGIRGSHTRTLDTRSKAVDMFLQCLDAGEVTRVSGDMDVRIHHTPESYLARCRYCQAL